MCTRFARVSVVVAAGIVLLATGCGVHSLHPLSSPEEATIDEALLGVWRLRLTDDKSTTEVFFHIGRSDDGPFDETHGRLSCQVVQHGADGRILPVRSVSLFTTTIDDFKIANLRWNSDSSSGHYTFAKYKVEDAQLQLFTMREKPVHDAVDKGELHGRVVWAFPTESVVLTDDAATLHAFVAQADHEQLFGSSTTLIFDRITR